MNNEEKKTISEGEETDEDDGYYDSGNLVEAIVCAPQSTPQRSEDGTCQQAFHDLSSIEHYKDEKGTICPTFNISDPRKQHEQEPTCTENTKLELATTKPLNPDPSTTKTPSTEMAFNVNTNDIHDPPEEGTQDYWKWNQIYNTAANSSEIPKRSDGLPLQPKQPAETQPVKVPSENSKTKTQSSRRRHAAGTPLIRNTSEPDDTSVTRPADTHRRRTNIPDDVEKTTKTDRVFIDLQQDRLTKDSNRTIIEERHESANCRGPNTVNYNPPELVGWQPPDLDRHDDSFTSESNTDYTQKLWPCTKGCGNKVPYNDKVGEGLCAMCFEEHVRETTLPEWKRDESTTKPIERPKESAITDPPKRPDPTATESQHAAFYKDMLHPSTITTEFPQRPTDKIQPIAQIQPIPASTIKLTKKRNRCSHCHHKVKLTDKLWCVCRCEKLFCPPHRHQEDHVCTFDYKTHLRHQMAKQYPKVVASKIQHI